MSVFKYNLAVLAAVLKSIHAVSAYVRYAGSGDDGGSVELEIDFEPGAADVSPPNVATQRMEYRAGSATKVVAVSESDFDSAMEDLCWDAISESGNSGWENNRGGFGTFTLFADGSANLEHNDYFIADEKYDFELQADSPLQPLNLVLTRAMEAAGAATLTVTYRGGGDEREPNKIKVTSESGSEVSIGEVTYTLPNAEQAKTASFDDAVDDLVNAVLEHFEQENFDEEDGGEGTLTLTVAGALTVKHTNFCEDSKQEVTLFQADEAMEEAEVPA